MSIKGYVNPRLLWEPVELQARLHVLQLCLVDTRAGEEYAQVHIPGRICSTFLGSACVMLTQRH